MSLRMLIADDHDLIRRGVKAILESHDGWEVCAEASTGREAVAKARKFKPDIAILDVGMPDLNGLEAAKAIRNALPATEILMVSVHQTDRLIQEIVDSGVRGYVLKSDSERDLVLAVENLANHKSFFAPRVTELILGGFNSSSFSVDAPHVLPERLTPRERQMIKLISEGKGSKVLGSIFGINTKAAETERSNVMRKLDAHTVAEVVRYALRNGIIEE
jgi:DNA-binding NarL/FixJ family response regulator